ncbi:MAG: hypothetical protein AB1649_25395 [Chloroflexota bacterium]
MDAINYIVETILKLRQNRTLLIAFDGADTSGKTTLANSVHTVLKSHKFDSIRVSMDKFYHAREKRFARGELSPEGFFYDSTNYDAVFRCVIFPVKESLGYILPGVYDYRSEKPIEPDKIRIDSRSIVLIDGKFMNRDELCTYWDLSVFLEVAFDTIIERALIRDLELFGTREEVLSRYVNRYIPSEQLYMEKCNPAERASIVIDNDDYRNPRVIKEYVPS